MRHLICFSFVSFMVFLASGCGGDSQWKELGKTKSLKLALLDEAQRDYLRTPEAKHKETIAKLEKEVKELDAKIEKLSKEDRDQLKAKHSEIETFERAIKENEEKIKKLPTK